MKNDHIIILKKIPVDPKHVESLRIHKEKEVLSSSVSTQHGIAHSSSPVAYRVFSFLLFFAFLINPIGVAYAEEVTPLPEVPETPTEEEAPVVPEPGVTVVTPPTESETLLPDDVSGSALDGAVPLDDVVVVEEASPSEGTEETSPSETGTSTATSTEDALPVIEGDSGTSTATTTDDGGGGEILLDTEGTTGTSTEDTATSTETIDDVATAEELATNLDRPQTPEEKAAEQAVAEAVMREQIRKEVEAEMRARCVSYGDEGYYCLDETSSQRITTTRPIEYVVSEVGPGGDKEIVLVRTLPEGETREFITDNNVDDEFPSGDGEMRMLVWQSLMSGRWQIAYKEKTGVVEYLTANPDGNGHPATDGKRIVWQGWSETHWDIFLAEPGDRELSFSTTSVGVLEGIHPGWKVSRLSDSTAHDMFPKIAGNFVTWQEHQGGDWVIVVYDLSTGQIRRVKGEAGGTGEAPTVALIFKERTKEGRVFIRASDLASGERIPLRENELPEPATLPIPEQSGALPLQNGTSSVTSIRGEGDGDAGAPPETP